MVGGCKQPSLALSSVQCADRARAAAPALELSAPGRAKRASWSKPAALDSLGPLTHAAKGGGGRGGGGGNRPTTERNGWGAPVKGVDLALGPGAKATQSREEKEKEQQRARRQRRRERRRQEHAARYELPAGPRQRAPTRSKFAAAAVPRSVGLGAKRAGGSGEPQQQRARHAAPKRRASDPGIATAAATRRSERRSERGGLRATDGPAALAWSPVRGRARQPLAIF